MRKLCAVFVAAALVACGGDEEATRIVETRNPKPAKVSGAVAGRVLDIYQQPLAGAVVEVSTREGARSTTVDAEGYFTLPGLSAGGTVEVRITAEGHTTARIAATIPANAGEFLLEGNTLDIGEISLLSLESSVSFPVRDIWGNQLLVEGAVCEVAPAWLEHQSTTIRPRGLFRTEAASIEGELRCDAIPSIDLLGTTNSSLRIYIPAQDFDADGHPEFDGLFIKYTGADLMEAAQTPIVLTSRHDGLDIVSSNIPFLMDPATVFPPIAKDQELFIEFNLPVELLVGFAGSETAGKVFEASFEVEDTIIRIRPEDEWMRGVDLGVILIVRAVGSPTNEPFEVFAVFVAEPADEIAPIAYFEDADENGVAELDELIRFSLGGVCVNQSPNTEISFAIDADLDSSGTIGDAPYELGHGTLGTASLNQGITLGGSFEAPVEIPGGVDLILYLNEAIVFDANGQLMGELVVPLVAGKPESFP